MDTDDRRRAIDIAKDQRQRSFDALSASFIPGIYALESEQAKVRPTSWKAHIGDLF
jgi:hypothetical protein